MVIAAVDLRHTWAMDIDGGIRRLRGFGKGNQTR
jgi:hypothetical protein